MKSILSIREFSEFSGVSIPTLRHWDEIGLLPPRKSDPVTHYRYYTPDQIISTKFIVLMRSLGVPLKTIGKIHRVRNPAKIIRVLEHQRRLLDEEMHRLHECYSIINTRLRLMQDGMHVEEGFHAVDGLRVDKGSSTEGGTWIDETTISVLYHEEQPFILGPPNEWPEGKTAHDSFAELCRHAKDLHINLNFPIGAYYESMETFLKAPRKHKHFISLDPFGNHTKPAGDYLTGFSRGDYDAFTDLTERMNAYMQEHMLEARGPVYTTYLHDEICVQCASQYLMQASVEVRKKRRL